MSTGTCANIYIKSWINTTLIQAKLASIWHMSSKKIHVHVRSKMTMMIMMSMVLTHGDRINPM